MRTIFNKPLAVLLVLSAALMVNQAGWSQPAAQRPLVDQQWLKCRPMLELLPVLNQGRLAPLDTLARETMRWLTGRERFSSSKAPHPWLTRDPLVNLLSIVTASGEWRQIPCVLVEHLEVKTLLGVAPETQWLTLAELEEPGRMNALLRAIRQHERQGVRNTAVDRGGLQLLDRCNRLNDLLAHQQPYLVAGQSATGEVFFYPPSQLSRAEPTGWAKSWQVVLRSFAASDYPQLEQGTEQLLAYSQQTMPQIMRTGKLEIHYNRLKPFRLAWVALLLGVIAMGSGVVSRSRLLYWLSWAGFLAGLGLSSYGLVLRCMVAGRLPLANMYESILVAGWGVLLLSLLWELYQRNGLAAGAGALTGMLVFVMADWLPFDNAIKPLVPVLRSNYWLFWHVLTIVLSYSAFLLAMVLGHVYWIARLVMPAQAHWQQTSQALILRAIQCGVVLLTIGTILGGVWANRAWGRFWGWDPKETWSLVTILGYSVLLHARLAGWTGQKGFASGAIVAFQLVLMTWYGVNYIIASGLHSYGFGEGRVGYLLGYVIVDILFVVVCHSVAHKRTN